MYGFLLPLVVNRNIHATVLTIEEYLENLFPKSTAIETNSTEIIAVKDFFFLCQQSFDQVEGFHQAN